jgi:Chorismate mutase
MTDDTAALETVRKDIDAIDTAIHDLIMRRTQLVEQVRRIKEDWAVKIQPSREAEIIYRLLARHNGPFPKRELVAIWRLLITATLSFEGPFSVAVYVAGEDAAFWDLARDHFGPYTPVARHGTVRGVIEAVRRQEAAVGVLPLPTQDDPDPWWRHLISSHVDAPRIIARLPFAGPGNSRGGSVEALVICPVVVVPTGRDRVLVAGETYAGLTMSQFTAALKQAGLTPGFTASWQEIEPPHPLLLAAELDGFVSADDDRLKQVESRLGKSLNRLLWLGGYATPLSTEELGAGWSPPAAATPRPPRSEGTQAP